MYISDYEEIGNYMVAKVAFSKDLRNMASVYITKDNPEEVEDGFLKIEIKGSDCSTVLGEKIIKSGITTYNLHAVAKKFAKDTLINMIKSNTIYTDIIVSHNQYNRICDISKKYDIPDKQIVYKLIQYGLADYNKYEFCSSATGNVEIKINLSLSIEKRLNQAMKNADVNYYNVMKTIIGYGLIKYDQSNNKRNFLK